MKWIKSLVQCWLRSARNEAARRQGYGGCGRCGDTWNWKKAHETPYLFCDYSHAFDAEGHYRGSKVSLDPKDTVATAMFPLCEECWQALTPEQRLPYYRTLVARWNDPKKDELLPQIEKCVLLGL